MNVKSEKVFYEKEVNEALATVDAECILWGEDLYDMKVVLYPKKIALIPGYEEIKNDLVNAALVYFDFSREQYIKSSIVRFDWERNIIYIAEKNFNAIWRYLRRSVDLGIRIQKENGAELPVEAAEDVVDLFLLQKKGSEAVIRGGQLKHVAREIPEEEKLAQGRKQSLLDQQKYKYFYGADGDVFHDKDCEYIKEIAPESFMASDHMPEGLKPCKKCKRRMFLREACSPYVKQIPYVDQLLSRGGIMDLHLERFVYEEGLKFKVDHADELTVKGREDTWIIKGFDKNYLSLWHNNYVKTAPRERYITQGFHNQKMNGKKLYSLLEYVCGYTFDKHLAAEDRVEQARLEEIKAEEERIKRESSLIYRIKAFWKRLLMLIFPE